MAVQGISWLGIALRVVFAVALVLLTFNPTGYSFYHWVMSDTAGVIALKAFAGVALLIGWVICLRTAFVALGWLGVILGLALLGTLVWLLVEMNWVDPNNPSGFAWIALLMVGVVLGIGLSWSLIRTRVTGQVEVD
jgi:Family of unknown function (DUF6524)